MVYVTDLSPAVLHMSTVNTIVQQELQESLVTNHHFYKRFPAKKNTFFRVFWQFKWEKLGE